MLRSSVFIAVIILLFTTSCGIKGDLYLEDTPNANKKQLAS